jgi:SMODS and SLOG-associating 2TM effector domain
MMSEKQANAAENQVDYVETQAENYERFCRRVGIWPMSLQPPASDASKRRPAKNKSTYEQLVHAQSKCRAEYYTTASLINFALGAQIVLAAAVTAISAASGPKTAITILGACNTVLAGSLTWVKGQGLPDRLLKYANELRRVREHIEDLERQYEARPDFRLDVEEAADKIYTMYDNARKNAESEYSGTFKTLSTEALKGDWRSATDRQHVPEGSRSAPKTEHSKTAGFHGALTQRAPQGHEQQTTAPVVR